MPRKGVPGRGFPEVWGDNSEDLQIREIRLPTGRGTAGQTHQGCGQTWAELSGRQGAAVEDQAQQDGVLPEMMVLTQPEGEAFRKGGPGRTEEPRMDFQGKLVMS